MIPKLRNLLAKAAPLPTGAILVVQALLAAVTWGALGFASASGTWLFDIRQASLAVRFFRWQFPVLGAAGAILLPAILYDRLRVEAEESPLLDREFVERVLRFPRLAALAAFLTSVFVFTLGATEMRLLVHSPVEESIKMFLLGPVTGMVFGCLSYFAISVVDRPLVAAALEKGGLPPAEVRFSIARKVFLCALALSLVTLGLYGPIALTLAERSSEVQTSVVAEQNLARVAVDLKSTLPENEGAWRSFLEAHLAPFDELAVAVAGGPILALVSKPGRQTSFFLRPENVDFLSIRQPGSFASRRDDNLVVSNMRIGEGMKLYSSVRPDRSLEGRLLREMLRLGVAILVLGIVISWVAGRGVAAPIAELSRGARAFAADPKSELFLVPSDDETAVLAGAFAEMANSVRLMQQRLAASQRLAGAAESLAAVAHEIRNPLFGITSTVAALEAELGDDPRYRAHFDVVRRESERVSRMIGEMLTLKTAPMRSEEVDLEGVVESAAEWARSRFAEANPAISLRVAPYVPPILGDRDRLFRVFANLFENALNGEKKGVRVDVSILREDAFVVAEVRDSGEGVPPELFEKIFEPFFSRRPGGSGLGLSICRTILEEHRGRIDVAANPNGGAIFIVRIPIPAAPSAV